MSQTSTLEEISQWSPDMCRKELPEMLPRLVSMYQNSDNWEKDIRVFNLVIEMFLPHVSLMELEQNVLSQVLPKVVKLFDSLVYEISSQASDLSSQNSDLKSSLRNILQNMVQWLVNLSACVRQVFTFEGSINLENIHSLPKSVLHVLRAAFGHCKESDSMYSGRLHLVSDLLQALFKEAVSLQKLLMELLDKINVKSMDSEKTTADMVAVLHMVLEICSVVSKMDHALHANTWKFIIKQSLKHQALVESQLRHQDIVNGLCDDILLSFQSCLQLAENIKLSGSQDSTDQRLFQKTTKLCRFFGNSLVHYTKEFMPFLSGSCVRLHRLYLQIHSQFPPSLFAYPISEEHKNEIKCVFMVVFEPLILQFFSCIPFVESVLSENLVLPAEHIFPQCQLLINILDKLPNQAEDVQMLWCHKSRFPEEIPRMGIFQAVFQNFLQCSPELTMPLSLQGVSVNGQNPNDVTFYEYVCIHLCAYIVSLPPALFPYLEHALLDAVLSCSMVTSLLAMDTWCFLARYGTADLCAHHVQILAHLVKSLPSASYQKSQLTVLLRRLLFLMAAEHQAEFIDLFPPLKEENFPVWENISLSAFSSTLRAKIRHDLITAAISHCKCLLNDRSTVNDLQQLNFSLSALRAACSSTVETVNKQQQSDVSRIISQLLAVIDINQMSSQTCLQDTFCLILGLLTCSVHTVEPPTLIQVLSLLVSVFKEDPPTHIKLTTLDLLTVLGKIFISHDAQAVVLPKISCLFSSLLADRIWLIKQHALETFAKFAEETNHEQVVPQSLTSDEMKNQVISFLNKTMFVTEIASDRFERLQKERAFLGAFFARARQKDEQENAQPLAKKARSANPIEEQCEVHLETAEKALNAVQLLMQDSKAPAWLSVKLLHIQSLLNSLQQRV